MRNTKDLIIKLMLVMALLFCAVFSSCAGKENDADVSSSAAESTGKTSEVSKETPSEVSSESESPANSLSESTSDESSLDPSEETSEGTEPSLPAEETVFRFFGKKTDPEVFHLNAATRCDTESGLTDLLSYAAPLRTEIVRMIESYTLPDTAYLGEAAFSEDRKRELLGARNLDVLQEDPESPGFIRYGILTDNADMRSFPTMEKAVDSLTENDHDRLQETRLPLGAGVVLLHVSKDGNYFFCQGDNYYGWIPGACVAFVSEEEFKEYLTADRFIVTLAPSLTLHGKNLRLGTTLPYRFSTEHLFVVDFPMRNSEDGSFYTESAFLRKDGSVSDGYQAPSFSSLAGPVILMDQVPYGWGDEHDLYDCSSAAGLLYRTLGIWLPRNTSDMHHFGGDVVDVREMAEEEKLRLIEERPGALLLMQGHVMMYLKKEGEEHLVFHETTGYNTVEGEYVSVEKAVTIPLERLYDNSGRSFTDRVLYIIDPLGGFR